MLGDYITSSAAWLAFNLIRYFTLEEVTYASSLGDYLRMPMIIRGQILIPLMLTGIYWLSGFYNRVFDKSRIEAILSTLGSTLFGTIIIYFAAIIDDPIPDRYSNYMLVAILELLLLTFVGAWRVIAATRIIVKRSRGDIWKNVIVIGSGDAIADCISRFNVMSNSRGLRIIGAVALDGKAPAGIDAIAPGELPRAVERLGADEFIIAMPGSGVTERMAVLRDLYRYNLPILEPGWYDNERIMPSRITNVAGDPLTDISSAVISESGRNIKRVADVAVSSLALVVLLPALAAIAVAVKASGRGPVIYSQMRVGRYGRPFRIYKFRTMIDGAEPDGPALSSDGDPRITRTGLFLRKYRLDELPQFWNVVKGDMSLVGPRPERAYFEEQIIARAPEYTRLHLLRPGITSWGMVKYGYASDVDQMMRRMRFDIIYLENMSFAIDLKILFFTVKTVLTGKGV